MSFNAVLFLAAVMRAPWRTVRSPAVLLLVTGIAGVAYGLIVVRRMMRQTVYKPQAEDWISFGLAPLAAYALIAVCAWEASSHLRPALFGIGAAALLLLFTGIHNAWDSVSYHVAVMRRREKGD